MITDFRSLCADLADIVTAHASPDDDAVSYVAAVLTRARAALAAEPELPADNRSCTCHPDDNPPTPCPKRYALNECRESADREVAELVAALRADAECAEVEHYDLCNMTADQMLRAADLLERLAPQPLPVRPTNEELWKLEDDMGGSPEDSLWCRKYARAVLARWGVTNNKNE